MLINETIEMSSSSGNSDSTGVSVEGECNKMKDFHVELEHFNDGHSPGGTSVPTRIAQYRNKQSTNFLSVFDNVMPEDWCTRAYDYGVEKGKPWGK